MKIEILSDLHLDINEKVPFKRKDKKIFAIICGDISSVPSQTIQWIHDNVEQGIFVEGNHIGYSSQHSVQFIEHLLSQSFPISGPVSFLNNNYKIINDTIFVGGTLWTDFCLNGKAFQTANMHIVSERLNDYRYNYANTRHLKDETNDNFTNLFEKNLVKKMCPSDSLVMFNNTLNTIKNVAERFHDKKIVVITHHAPSMQSVGAFYKNDLSNAGFCSNLENFILDHPNIKLWCHGHIHTSSDYMIGNCRVVCNPRGYEALHETHTDFKSEFITDMKLADEIIEKK